MLFDVSDELRDLNIADFFVEESYKNELAGKEETRLVLNIEKIRERGKLVKKLKTSKGELEVESYDALTALGMKQRVAENILNYAMRLKEFSDLEARIAALEERLK